MPTSLAPTLSLDKGIIPERTLWFFRHKLRRAFHRWIRREFDRLERSGQLNRKELAARLGMKHASSITRWFNAPGNLELDTISDLLVGMAVDPTSGLVDAMTAPDAPVTSASSLFEEAPPRAAVTPLRRDPKSVQRQPPPSGDDTLQRIAEERAKRLADERRTQFDLGEQFDRAS